MVIVLIIILESRVKVLVFTKVVLYFRLSTTQERPALSMVGEKVQFELTVLMNFFFVYKNKI